MARSLPGEVSKTYSDPISKSEASKQKALGQVRSGIRKAKRQRDLPQGAEAAMASVKSLKAQEKEVEKAKDASISVVVGEKVSVEVQATKLQPYYRDGKLDVAAALLAGLESELKTFGVTEATITKWKDYNAKDPQGKFDLLVSWNLIPSGSEYSSIDSSGNVSYLAPEIVAARTDLKDYIQIVDSRPQVDVLKAVEAGKTQSLLTYGVSQADVDKWTAYSKADAKGRFDFLVSWGVIPQGSSFSGVEPSTGNIQYVSPAVVQANADLAAVPGVVLAGLNNTYNTVAAVEAGKIDQLRALGIDPTEAQNFINSTHKTAAGEYLPLDKWNALSATDKALLDNSANPMTVAAFNAFRDKRVKDEWDLAIADLAPYKVDSGYNITAAMENGYLSGKVSMAHLALVMGDEAATKAFWAWIDKRVAESIETHDGKETWGWSTLCDITGGTITPQTKEYVHKIALDLAAAKKASVTYENFKALPQEKVAVLTSMSGNYLGNNQYNLAQALVDGTATPEALSGIFNAPDIQTAVEGADRIRQINVITDKLKNYRNRDGTYRIGDAINQRAISADETVKAFQAGLMGDNATRDALAAQNAAFRVALAAYRSQLKPGDPGLAESMKEDMKATAMVASVPFFGSIATPWPGDEEAVALWAAAYIVGAAAISLMTYAAVQAIGGVQDWVNNNKTYVPRLEMPKAEDFQTLAKALATSNNLYKVNTTAYISSQAGSSSGLNNLIQANAAVNQALTDATGVTITTAPVSTSTSSNAASDVTYSGIQGANTSMQAASIQGYQGINPTDLFPQVLDTPAMTPGEVALVRPIVLPGPSSAGMIKPGFGTQLVPPITSHESITGGGFNANIPQWLKDAMTSPEIFEAVRQDPLSNILFSTGVGQRVMERIQSWPVLQVGAYIGATNRSFGESVTHWYETHGWTPNDNGDVSSDTSSTGGAGVPAQGGTAVIDHDFTHEAVAYLDDMITKGQLDSAYAPYAGTGTSGVSLREQWEQMSQTQREEFARFMLTVAFNTYVSTGGTMMQGGSSIQGLTPTRIGPVTNNPEIVTGTNLQSTTLTSPSINVEAEQSTHLQSGVQTQAGVQVSPTTIAAEQVNVQPATMAQVSTNVNTDINVTTATQTATQTKTDAQVKTSTATDTATEDANVRTNTAVQEAERVATNVAVNTTVPKIGVSKPLQRFMKLSPDQRGGSVSWKQGIMYHLIHPPFGNNDLISSRQPFPGVPVFDGPKSAYRSLTVKGVTPAAIKRELGIMSIDFDTEARTMRFTTKDKRGRKPSRRKKQTVLAGYREDAPEEY